MSLDSSGCILAAAKRFCADHPDGDLNIALFLPDGGRAYLSTIFNPDWCAEKGIQVNFPFSLD